MKKEFVQEQYEDAMFSLLAANAVENRGAQAFEEREKLNGDPAFEIPAELENSCMKLIRKDAAKQSAKHTRRLIKMTLYRMAAVACAAIVLFATVLAVSPKLKASALNFLIQRFEEKTAYSFGDRLFVSDAPDVRVTWLPGKFDLISQEQNSSHTYLIYQNEEGAFLRIRVITEKGSVSIDTENTAVSKVTVNEYTATYTDDGTMKTIVWGIEPLKLTVLITGAGISESDVLQIAAGLRVTR